MERKRTARELAQLAERVQNNLERAKSALNVDCKTYVRGLLDQPLADLGVTWLIFEPAATESDRTLYHLLMERVGKFEDALIRGNSSDIGELRRDVISALWDYDTSIRKYFRAAIESVVESKGGARQEKGLERLHSAVEIGGLNPSSNNMTFDFKPNYGQSNFDSRRLEDEHC